MPQSETAITQWLRDGAAEASDRPEDQAWARRMFEAADVIDNLRNHRDFLQERIVALQGCKEPLP